jgi:chemotaxis protein MotB
MKPLLVITILVAIALAAFATYLYDGRQRAGHQADSLTTLADSLRMDASDLRHRNAEILARLDSQSTQASQEKEAEINRLKGTYDQLQRDMQAEIADGQIQITRLADQLKVSMVDRVLFPSGEAEITPAGYRVLRRIGDILRGTEGKVIRVEGHTDNVAISKALKSKFATNWELSTARATTVVRFLQDSVGIEPKRLWAVGLSEYHPVANNTTPRGRGQNRRIEIGLLPEPTGSAE